MSTEQAIEAYAYQGAISDICDLGWENLTTSETTDVAWAYYFFSIQFRENLEIACDLLPNDPKLQQLKREECDTANLSPWPGVAAAGERMNHDEFMKRLLTLSPIAEEKRRRFHDLGAAYLENVRGADSMTRAMSIASYEDGGLENVFTAILRSPSWDGPLLRAFGHFLSEHIRFDSDPDQGHGALSRHIRPDDRILPLWTGFRDLLVAFTPALKMKARVPAPV